MQACKEVKKAARYTAITAAINLVLVITATYLFGLPGFFLTVTLGPLSNIALLLYVTRSDLEPSLPAWSLLKTLSRFGSFSMLAHAAEVANATGTVVLLRFLTQSDYEVGLYSIGLVVMVNIRLIPLALMRAAFPYLADLVRNGLRFHRRLTELALKQTAVMTVIVAAWKLLGYYAIILVFGSRYADSFSSSTVLVLVVIPLSVGLPWVRALAILDKMQWAFLAAVIQLVVNVLVCVWLIPLFGASGAALAVVVGESVGTVIKVFAGRVFVRRLPGRQQEANGSMTTGEPTES
jgi:O-antigen/teichoic acid export membrane protein